MAINFTYDRKVGELILKADGFVFGRLYDCEVTWLFEAHSLQLEEDANSRFEADFSVAEKLAAIKAAYIDYDADCRAEAKAERISEAAFYNKLENGNPEAFEEMVRQDMMGYS
jgi:hypothetical protein